MRSLFLIIVLVLPFSLTAQTPLKKNSINISTGIAIGSSTSNYYGENTSINLGAATREDYPTDIAAALNYRFGIDYQRATGRGFSLKAGLRIASWNLTTTSQTNEKSILNNLFLEIPLAVQYTFGQNKWRPYIDLGLNPMFRIGHNNYSTSATIAIHTAIGISYQIAKNISLYGQLAGRFQTIGSIDYVSHDAGFYTKRTGRYLSPYEIGLEVGLAFAF